MKKPIIASLMLMTLSGGILLNSCKKEELIQPQIPSSGVSINPASENGQFSKEITVTDESGKNSLFLAVCSDYQSAIDEYLKTTKLKLIIEKDDFIETVKQTESTNRKSVESVQQHSTIDKKRTVTVDVISSNFEDNVKGYSLDVTIAGPKDPKQPTVNFADGGVATYYNNASDFCGVVHWGFGYDIFTVVGWKGWILGPWNIWATAYLTANTTNPALYAGYVYKPSSYRTQAMVKLDYYQSTVNYKVVFTQDEYRGKNCSIGTFDYMNSCYVGTPPSGTTAFIYANIFYYTPVPNKTLPEDKCPRLGSWWDGANCGTVYAPSGSVPFTWANNWYVKTDLLPL